MNPKDSKLTSSSDLRERKRQLSRQDQYLSALQLAEALGSSAKAPKERLTNLRGVIGSKSLGVSVWFSEKDVSSAPRCSAKIVTVQPSKEFDHLDHLGD